jgi:lysophospholipase L1-like esterase
LYSIFTVGGSTTECSLLDDKKTWTALLGEKLKAQHPKLWINNAGLDGATTYGHNILLDDYLLKLKPNMIIFLIGVNDRGKKDFNNEDAILIDRRESLIMKLIKKSEIANLSNNIYMMYKTHKVNIGHDLGKSKNQDALIEYEVDSLSIKKMYFEHKLSLSKYKSRIDKLSVKCIKNNIKPVFVTQPLLYAGQAWAIMELYNQELKKYCLEKNIDCIDLANLMPKKALYFYDEMHYTNKGAEVVADLIYQNIKYKIN